LSIIDLAGGAQPLANETGDVHVTFNGEIFNYQSLRRLLLDRGHALRTSSDTEVLVHLWEDEGPAMVSRLRGMFAFAIWDAQTRTLFVARDRLGVKPLVYRHTADRLEFASELKALAREPDFPRELDPTALVDYLAYQYVPHPKTIWSAARKLPPGHWLRFEAGRLKIERYWSPPFGEEETVRDEAEYRGRLRELLTEATRLRMISEVPIGSFLSGGIDSTIVTGLMQSLADRPIKTFSIGFPIKDYDETSFARLAARHLGTEHEEFHVEPKGVEVLPKLAWFHDEPFADSSAIPTWYVSKLARQRVTVALTGDAGDEMFGGYERYLATRIGERVDRLPGPIRAILSAKIWQRIPGSVRQKSRIRQLKKLLAHLGEEPETRYLRFLHIFDGDRRQRLLRPELVGYDPDERIRELYRRFPGRDFVTRTTAVDVESYLPCDILTKVDIASMSVALECRSPLLDHEVVEFAARMPIRFKIRGRTLKCILKETFPDLLPPAIRSRGKMGFGVPVGDWFRGELSGIVDDRLDESAVRRRGWLEPTEVRRLIDEHRRGEWDHGPRLWALVMLEEWARQHLDVGQ
jgi:asparagine synthase (glutamine-hydrolysing)